MVFFWIPGIYELSDILFFRIDDRYIDKPVGEESRGTLEVLYFDRQLLGVFVQQYEVVKLFGVTVSSGISQARSMLIKPSALLLAALALIFAMSVLRFRYQVWKIKMTHLLRAPQNANDSCLQITPRGRIERIGLSFLCFGLWLLLFYYAASKSLIHGYCFRFALACILGFVCFLACIGLAESATAFGWSGCCVDRPIEITRPTVHFMQNSTFLHRGRRGSIYGLLRG